MVAISTVSVLNSDNFTNRHLTHLLATKPGAGREADRLMEQKGIQKSEPGKPAPVETSPSGTKEKQSVTQKIKDKLHIGTGKHI
jgi:hypothetical protein